MIASHSEFSTEKVRVCVFGTGSLGREHARVYSSLAAAGIVEFVGVYDIDSETANKIAEKYGVRAFRTVSEVGKSSNAASIVTPTHTHFELARTLLMTGKHVLLEKPMTDNTAQAAELVRLALERNAYYKLGMWKDSTRYSTISRVSPPNPASSKRIASPLIQPAAPISESCSI